MAAEHEYDVMSTRSQRPVCGRGGLEAEKTDSTEVKALHVSIVVFANVP